MANEAVDTKKKPPFDMMAYLRNTRAELGKITWPTRRETTISTVMVFIMATLMSVFLFVTDQVVSHLVRFILGVNG